VSIGCGRLPLPRERGIPDIVFSGEHTAILKYRHSWKLNILKLLTSKLDRGGLIFPLYGKVIAFFTQRVWF